MMKTKCDLDSEMQTATVRAKKICNEEKASVQN